MPLRAENVSYTYSEGTAYEMKALNDASLEIKDGEFLGLIGHTGSGKSTLIQLFNGLIRPSSGRVLFNGEDIWANGYDRRKLRFHVGLVFQYPDHQLFETTVLKDVCFGPKNKGLSDEEAKEAAIQALKHVRVSESYFEKSPFDLSGGQKRRVAIAGVLAMEPEVLILDEPTAGLDPKGRDEILDTLNEMQDTRGISVVLVSHSMEDVAKYVDRLIVMNRGEIFCDGAPKEVFRQYKELEQIGLSAPQITYLMHELKNRGMNVDENAITVEEAKKSVLDALREKR
ncbi:MAG: energy-coupling factor transporter ATPase [Lachnospiraceae bacterium]|nr:energy-coupling factor transporter ATPase [Lachnospiraceae bacterium]